MSLTQSRRLRHSNSLKSQQLLWVSMESRHLCRKHTLNRQPSPNVLRRSKPESQRRNTESFAYALGNLSLECEVNIGFIVAQRAGRRVGGVPDHRRRQVPGGQ